jgi:hypothetical protein
LLLVQVVEVVMSVPTRISAAEAVAAIAAAPRTPASIEWVVPVFMVKAFQRVTETFRGAPNAGRRGRATNMTPDAPDCRQRWDKRRFDFREGDVQAIGT